MYISTVTMMLAIASVGLGALAVGSSNGMFQQESLVLGQTSSSNSSESNNNTTSLDTFNAAGRINSLAVDTLLGSNSTLGTHTGDLWILGGNWSFSVDSGNLTDFKVDIVMTEHDGSGRHMHSISNLTEATGAVPPLTESNIALTNGNYTSFLGNASITTGGEIKYENVPIAVYLLNGNILNMTPDPIKTEHHFKGLPIYGTVYSITDESGNELRN